MQDHIQKSKARSQSSFKGQNTGLNVPPPEDPQISELSRRASVCPSPQLLHIRKWKEFEKFPSVSKIILDVDTGCDDAHAILLLAYLAQKFDKQIIGITCVNGNTSLENVITNTLITIKQTKQKIKVYPGANKNIMTYPTGDDFFGKDGLNNKQQKYKSQLTQEDWDLVQKQSAYSFIVNSARKYKKDLIIACAAPLTNLAIAYLLDNQLPSYIAGITIMGGSYSGVGMNEAFSAEFNFYGDVEAASIVIKQFKNIVLVPIQLAFQYPNRDFKNFFSNQTTSMGKYITDVFKGMQSYYLCDPMILFPIFYPQFITKVYKVYGQVCREGERTRGFLAINWIPSKNTHQFAANLQIILEMDYDLVNEVMHNLVVQFSSE